MRSAPFEVRGSFISELYAKSNKKRHGKKPVSVRTFKASYIRQLISVRTLLICSYFVNQFVLC